MDVELLSLKAGKLLRNGKQLVADPRKGNVFVVKTQDDLVQLVWVERTEQDAVPEDGVVIFPHEATVEAIPGQHALAVKFPEEPDRNQYFWLQEPASVEAAHAATCLDRALNLQEAVPLQPAQPGQQQQPQQPQQVAAAQPLDGRSAPQTVPHAPPTASQPTAAPAAARSPAEGEVPAALQRMLAQMLGQGGGAAQTTQGQLAAGHTGSALMTQLAQQWASFQSGLASGAGGVGAQARHAAFLSEASGFHGPRLDQVLRPAHVLAALDADMAQALTPFLAPEEQQGVQGGSSAEAAVRAALSSSEVKHQLRVLSQALATRSLDVVQFGLPPLAGSSTEALFAAIQALVDNEERSKHPGAAPLNGLQTDAAPMQDVVHAGSEAPSAATPPSCEGQPHGQAHHPVPHGVEGPVGTIASQGAPGSAAPAGRDAASLTTPGAPPDDQDPPLMEE